MTRETETLALESLLYSESFIQTDMFDLERWLEVTSRRYLVLLLHHEIFAVESQTLTSAVTSEDHSLQSEGTWA